MQFEDFRALRAKCDTAALAVFVAASLTDLLDGRIARARNLITNFGILMDPLADKIMVCSAFIAFVGLNWMPAWMVVVILGRELLVTSLRGISEAELRQLIAKPIKSYKEKKK